WNLIGRGDSEESMRSGFNQLPALPLAVALLVTACDSSVSEPGTSSGVNTGASGGEGGATSSGTGRSSTGASGTGGSSTGGGVTTGGGGGAQCPTTTDACSE